MRLWVRSGVQINLSFGCSRAVGSASDTSNDKVLYQPIDPIARQQRFPKLPPALPNFFTLPYVIHVLVGEYQPHSLSRYEAKPACAEHSCLSGSTDPCCCSHETLLHIGLQSSHLNNCYYHQDLHQELFYSSLRQEIDSKPMPSNSLQHRVTTRIEYRSHS